MKFTSRYPNRPKQDSPKQIYAYIVICFFSKDTKAIQWKKRESFQQSAGTIGYPYTKNEIYLYFSPHTKINPKYIIEIDAKPKI